MLDPQGRGEVIATVTALCRERGITVVLITHHMALRERGVVLPEAIYTTDRLVSALRTLGREAGLC